MLESTPASRPFCCCTSGPPLRRPLAAALTMSPSNATPKTATPAADFLPNARQSRGPSAACFDLARPDRPPCGGLGNSSRKRAGMPPPCHRPPETDSTTAVLPPSRAAPPWPLSSGAPSCAVVSPVVNSARAPCASRQMLTIADSPPWSYNKLNYHYAKREFTRRSKQHDARRP